MTPRLVTVKLSLGDNGKAALITLDASGAPDPSVIRQKYDILEDNAHKILDGTGLSFEVGGITAITRDLTRNIIPTQTITSILALILCGILLILLFRSFYYGLITLTVVTDRGESHVAGTVFPAPECRIVRIDDYRMEAPLEGRMLLISNYDRPGVIGFLGTTLGSHQVNIADMHLSRIRSKGMAICLVTVDNPVPPEALQALSDYDDIVQAEVIEV